MYENRGVAAPRPETIALVTALTLVLTSLALVRPASAAVGEFTTTGSMAEPRWAHTQSTLNDGSALVVGGMGDFCGFFCVETWDTAEIYDPDEGTFTATGSMALGRSYHTATVLDDGRVLIAGGWPPSLPFGGATDTAEIYDPDTGTFTSTGSMTSKRKMHAAALLPDGRVLVTGGLDETTTPLASAEIYDPGTGTFTATGDMSSSRYDHTASTLDSGKVLVVGGRTTGAVPQSTTELFDSGGGSFTGSGSMNTPRSSHSATVLQDGSVLVAGGDDTDVLQASVASAERYDPDAGTFSNAGSMTDPREQMTASVLPTGSVLVAGGSDDSTVLSSADTFEPATDTFSATGAMATARRLQSASTLGDGTVLISGGNGNSGPHASAEIYDPPKPAFSVTPSTLTFGDHDISSNARSASANSKQVTVTNSGTADLSISKVAISGADAGDFGMTGTCSGTTLEPDTTCTVTVTFSPSSSGERSAQLRFTDNAHDSPQTVSMTGTGLPGKIPKTSLRVKARDKAKRLKLNKRTRVIRRIRTDGKVKRLTVTCYLHGQKLSATQKSSVCATWKNRKRGVVKARAKCNTGLSISAIVVAKRSGQSRSKWKRTWRVVKTPRSACSLIGNG